MRSRFWASLHAVLTRLNKRPEHPQNDRDGAKQYANSSEDSAAPPDDMLRAEWAALQTLIREIHQSDKQHQKTEHKLWTAQLGAAKRLNWITGIGAAVSFGALLGVGASVIIAKQAADDGHKALISANRAWIAPAGAVPDEAMAVGKDFHYHVIYNNTGKEPAVNIKEIFHADITNPPKSGETWDSLIVPVNNTCAGLNPKNGNLVIFPDIQFQRRMLIPGNKISTSITEGHQIFYVQGCAVYETFGAPHFSYYCFFFRPYLDKPIAAWPFDNCPGEDQHGAN